MTDQLGKLLDAMQSDAQTEGYTETSKIEDARVLLMAEFADDEITEGHYTTAFDGYLEEHADRFGPVENMLKTAAEIVDDFHAYMKWGYK